MKHRTNRAVNLVHRKSGESADRELLGPYRLESLLSSSEEGRATVYRVRLESGQKTRTSWHEIAEEFYFVLSGSGTAVLEGKSVPIAAGDFLRLPPGTRHAFVTAIDALEFLNFHVPGCRPDRDTYFAD